jgi:tetratricopeptide (TPR) repeat protein
LREGNYNEARVEAHEALKLFEEGIKQQSYNQGPVSHLTSIRRTLAGDPANVGRAYSLLGTIEALAGRSSDAVTHFQTALTHFEQYDCQREIAIACCNIGDAYLRKADYSQARAVLRRSLTSAERMGDIRVVSYVFGNLGVLNIRTGNLAEAEFRRGITLAERIDDSIMVSILHTYLGIVLQEQGKFPHAKATLSRALAIGRAMHMAPCMGFALIAIGGMRIAQAIAIDVNNEGVAPVHEEKIRVLKQAKKSLLHALTLEGLETETRIEGQLAQAQVSLLLSEGESALQQALQALEEARSSEQTWLVTRAQRILGSIFAAQGEQEQAEKYFEQALRTFRKRGMRLEYGRTLQQYGNALVQQDGSEGKRYAQGIAYLQEARQVFTECQAMLDLRSVEHMLAEHEQVKT